MYALGKKIMRDRNAFLEGNESNLVLKNTGCLEKGNILIFCQKFVETCGKWMFGKKFYVWSGLRFE